MSGAFDVVEIGGPGSRPVRVIGIDLGTTNLTVCEIVWEPGQDGPGPSRCLNIDQKTTQGRYTHVLVPSVVDTDTASWSATK
jgi:molecular chaperone DnaK (HSP70)